MIIEKMLALYGVKNCLLLVGSSNSLNIRTPFSFTVRQLMIKTLYPKLRVLPLPDSTPNLVKFSKQGDEVWLTNIKKLESKLGTIFHFVGGSKKDLKTLGGKFHTEVLIARHTRGRRVSATKVRALLLTGDIMKLGKLMDKAIIKIAKKQLKKD